MILPGRDSQLVGMRLERGDDEIDVGPEVDAE